MAVLTKETILSAMISGLAGNTGISVTDFLIKYKRLFERYVEWTRLKQLLEKGEPAESWNRIRQAQKLALGGQGGGENPPDQPLCSVFSNVSLDGSYPMKRYYMPRVLDIEAVMPCAKVRDWGCDGNIQGFYDELGLLMRLSPKDFEAFLVVMDALLEKYFWSVPVSGKQAAGVSLYDYIRTVTAITAVLVQGGQKDALYLIAAGHFSGIQKYIFSVSKEGTSGAAKRLRARSFYVNAMVSSLAHCMIHRIGLPMANILMLTGGWFYILLPNTEAAKENLRRTEEEATVFLYRRFKGNLSLELVWEKTAEEGLQDFGGLLRKLFKKIERKKKRPLESVLVNKEEWNTERFVVDQDLSHKSMCASCWSAFVEEGEEMCPDCLTAMKIGKILPGMKRFSFSRRKGQYQLWGDYYLNLGASADVVSNYLVMELNAPVPADRYDQPVKSYFAANHVPVKEGRAVKTFGEIAKMAKGYKRLGVLKAEADRAAFIISEGLCKEKGRYVSAAGVLTLSRMLDLFFGGYLHRLISGRYPEVYCVFSGGDALLCIGPWDQMPSLAVDINEAFHRYTGENQCMTLSAAVCIGERGCPVSVLAERCEDKLKQVKQTADSLISPEKRGRNGVYFLGKVMTWEDFQEQIERGRRLAKAGARVGTDILRRLAAYSAMYQDYLKNREAEMLMFLPLFSNDMVRSREALKKDPDFQRLCEEMYKKVSDYGKTEKAFYYLELCISYALQLTKGEQRNGGFLGRVPKGTERRLF